MRRRCGPGCPGSTSSRWCVRTAQALRWADRPELFLGTAPGRTGVTQPSNGERSLRERVAAEAEREMEDYYRAQLISRHVGGEFEGFISNVTNSGFFVQLDEHFVEGFLPAAFIEDDYYAYRQDLRSLVGRRNKRMFRLGDRIKVLVDSVDLDTHRILFSLA